MSNYTETIRTTITQPIDWVEAWRAAAEADGTDLSAWIGRRCNEGLTPAKRRKLSARRGRGKPPKGETK